jgi:hypothetical protein
MRSRAGEEWLSTWGLRKEERVRLFAMLGLRPGQTSADFEKYCMLLLFTLHFNQRVFVKTIIRWP